jgi:2-(1,2-epoxy-1,2-dihydrophenyl)acetyl-CoA isomerase
VGQKKAMELALTGNCFSPNEAQQWGMLNSVVGVEQLNDKVGELVDNLSSGPKVVLGRTKKMLNQTFDTSLSNRLDEEAKNFRLSMLEKDFTEGVTAFSEKRKPNFGK